MPTYDRETHDADDVEAALHALHSALTDDLEDLETKMRSATRSMTAEPFEDETDLHEYHVARAALHSGLASIAEVLGWIQWKTDEAPDGDVAVSLVPLPTLRGYSIH